MGRLGVILGSNAIGPGGNEVVAGADSAGAIVLQRHGGDSYVLPHLIDRAANLRSLVAAGCDRVPALGSVGSLRPEIGVGTLVCPDDFIALQTLVTTLDDARAHAMPGFDREWRAEVLTTWGAASAPAPARRQHLLADDWAALRDAGGDPADRRPRQPGRNDAGAMTDPPLLRCPYGHSRDGGSTRGSA